MKKRTWYFLAWLGFYFLLTLSIGVWLNWSKQQPPIVNLGLWIIVFGVIGIPASKKAAHKKFPQQIQETAARSQT